MLPTGNEIGMPGTEALLACLQLNTTLTTLDLAGDIKDINEASNVCAQHVLLITQLLCRQSLYGGSIRLH